MKGLVATSQGADGIFRITMSAPRSNALNPSILGELHAAFDAAEHAGAAKVLISGGRNFSTGGDVALFLEAAERGEANVYADRVVPRLQELVLRMVEMDAVIGVAARGAITGGSAGLLFAADLTVLAPDAFVQPYYCKVGFAPDGGWTALLPDLIGGAAARNWLLSDARKRADELKTLSLATSIDKDPERRTTKLLLEVETGAALASKRLIWDDDRRAKLCRRLDAETSAFRNHIVTESARLSMRKFLGKQEKPSLV